MNCWWIRKEGKCHLYTAWKHVYHQANTHERSEYSLTCFPIYSLQSALPWMFTHQNVNNLVFASQVIISSKLQTYLDHLRWGTVGKCTIEDFDWCLILFIAIGARFGVYAPKCKQFISHRTCLQKKTWNSCIQHSIFPSFFKQFGEHRSMIWQIMKQEANRQICSRI